MSLNTILAQKHWCGNVVAIFPMDARRVLSPAGRPRRAATPSDESRDNTVRARRKPPAAPDGPRRHGFPLN